MLDVSCFRQQLQRGEYQHIKYANFQNFFHQMLNISQVLASYNATDYKDCAFKCLEKMSCFSFNFATLPTDSNSGRHLCELLASDKYNHANSFVPSRDFHHFAIPVGSTIERCNRKMVLNDSTHLTGRLTKCPLLTVSSLHQKK